MAVKSRTPENKRTIEIFSAGCRTCRETIQLIKRTACKSCHVVVHEMQDTKVARRARDLGIRSVPAVVIDGKLQACCSNRGVDVSILKRAGLGQPIQA